MFVIGVTGGIGSGKSTFSEMLSEHGLSVIDADELSRRSTAAGGVAIEQIRETFGDEMIAVDGAVDRKKMADLVFRDKNKIDLLSSIVHANVISEMRTAVSKEEKGGAKAVVLDVPIPVKNGFLDVCDYIIVVRADDEVRVDRLIQRGMTEDEARRRISMQMSQDEYETLGHRTVINNGDRAALRESVTAFVHEELESRGIVTAK